MVLKFLIFSTFILCCVCDLDVVKSINVLKAEKDGFVSEECKNDMKLFKQGLLQSPQELWAIQMMDASGKIPSGRLEGNLNSLGYFEECLAVRGPNNIEGKYCAGYVWPATSNPESIEIPRSLPFSRVPSNVTAKVSYWGLCRPHTCSARDLNILRIGADLGLGIVFFTSDDLCQTESSQPEFTAGDYAVSIFLFCILLIIVASTSYDVYLDYAEKEPISNFCVCFSFLTNGRKLFQVSNDPKQLLCVSGIRTISMMWVILGHSFSSKLYQPIANPKALEEFYNRKSSMYMFGATVSVDSFFLLSGMLMVYVYMKSRQMKLLDIPLYYLHRYLRLTPPLAVLLIIHLTLYKFMGYGPLWPPIEKTMDDYCKEYWYTTLLYVQNYVNPATECIAHSWYLSVDMQLFLISPLILIPLKKFTKFTLAAVGLCAAVSIGLCFYAGWKYHLLPLYDSTIEQQLELMEYYYVPTHTRANVWFIGIILGYLVYEYKNNNLKFEINKFVAVLLWIVALGGLAACVFCGHNLLFDDDKVRNTLHITFVRPSWAICLSWVIFACITGYGGPINTFLSWPIFQVVARLSYSMYIIHLAVISIIFGSWKHPIWFNEANELYQFWAIFMLVLFISIIWTLAFESPIIIIEKSLKGKSLRRGNTYIETKKIGSLYGKHESIDPKVLEGAVNEAFDDGEILNETGKKYLDAYKNV